MRFWAVGVLLAVGCFNPSLQPGHPCSAAGTCPGDQVCDMRLVPPTCVDQLADLGDAGPDGPPPPPPCAIASDCPAALPVCGPELTCRTCRADSECPSDACHELEGTCADEATVAYVAPASLGTMCTRAAPCGTIAEALAVRGARTLIKVADGTYMSGGFEVRAVTGASTSIVISGPDVSWDGPVITAIDRSNIADLDTTLVIEGVTLLNSSSDGLNNRGTLTLSHVLIRGSASNGLQSQQGIVRVLDCQIEASGSGGVFVESGSIEIRRSYLLSNMGPGLNVAGAGLTLVNSIVGSNGSAGSTYGGVRIQASAGQTVLFRHNTIASNRNGGFGAVGVQCDQPVDLENSIFDNPTLFGASELSASCVPRHSLFKRDAPQMMGNKQGDPRFVSTTDFHIQVGSAAIDIADAASSEPLDIDGQARPTGGASDVGADELP